VNLEAMKKRVEVFINRVNWKSAKEMGMFLKLVWVASSRPPVKLKRTKTLTMQIRSSPNADLKRGSATQFVGNAVISIFVHVQNQVSIGSRTTDPNGAENGFQQRSQKQ